MLSLLGFWSILDVRVRESFKNTIFSPVTLFFTGLSHLLQSHSLSSRPGRACWTPIGRSDLHRCSASSRGQQARHHSSPRSTMAVASCPSQTPTPLPAGCWLLLLQLLSLLSLKHSQVFVHGKKFLNGFV